MSGSGALAAGAVALPRGPEDPDRDEIRARVGETLAALASLRGYSRIPEVHVLFEDRDFFARYYRRSAMRDMALEKSAARDRAYLLLGFLAPGQDILEAGLQAFLKDVKGLYDPASKVLYFADWVPPSGWEETLVHECAHALQDSRHDLGAFLKSAAVGSLDRQYALKSLVEGEATAMTLDLNLSAEGRHFADVTDLARLNRLHRTIERGRSRVSGRDDLPDESRTFHYVLGASFVQKVIRSRGWKGMDRVWDSPPDSTEQILHPEKYLAGRERPTAIRVQGLEKGPLKGWGCTWQDTLGEFALSLMLRRSLGEAEAAASCRGWAGDRWMLFERTGRGILVGYTLWDDEEAARVFFESHRSHLRDKYPQAPALRSDDTIEWISPEGGQGDVFLERLGRRVLFLEQVPAGLTRSLREDLWDRRSRKVPSLEPWL